jgi:hypothetical protein
VADNLADLVQEELVRLSDALTLPAESECLRCFLLRMLNDFGCDGTHRWTIRWRETRAPRARGLILRLKQCGGYCDCEVFLNVFPVYPETGEPLPCAGAPRRGSAAPCDLRGLRKTA